MESSMIHRASVLTVLTIFSLCCAYPTEAQDKRVLVQKLIEVTDTTSLMKNAAQTAAAAIMNTIKTSNPTISDETFNYIQEKVQTETLGVIKSFMEQLAYPIYEENFSDKELQSVIDFYSSPTGQ